MLIQYVIIITGDNMEKIIKAVAETLNEIKSDLDCGCHTYSNCGHSDNSITEIREIIERYFSILLKKLGGNPDKVTGEYGWEYASKH